MSTLAQQLRAALGTQHALIQAPMAGVQKSALALAVSRAGGLGSLPCAMLSPEELRAELQALQVLKAEGKPYNLNFFCHTPPEPNAVAHEAWLELLKPYYAELGLSTSAVTAGAGRAPFSEALCDLIEPFAPPVVSFHFGLPEPALLARVKRFAYVLSSATTAEEAVWLQANGADAVIAQGLEAGGHRGIFIARPEADLGIDWDADLENQLPLHELLPAILRAVPCPVIAAGAIADAADIAQVMRLGAHGVQLGTSFLLCTEATTSGLHRDALQRSQSSADRTALTRLFTGRPARGIANRLMDELGPLGAFAPEFPLATAGIAPLRAAAEARGKADFSPLWSGTNPRGAKAVSAAVLMSELIAGFGA